MSCNNAPAVLEILDSSLVALHMLRKASKHLNQACFCVVECDYIFEGPFSCYTGQSLCGHWEMSAMFFDA